MTEESDGRFECDRPSCSNYDTRDLKDFKVAVDVLWGCPVISRHAPAAEGKRVVGNCSATRAKVANVAQCR